MLNLIILGVAMATIITLGVEAISYKLTVAKIIANAKRDNEENMINSRIFFAKENAKMDIVKGLIIINLVIIVVAIGLAQIIL